MNMNKEGVGFYYILYRDSRVRVTYRSHDVIDDVSVSYPESGFTPGNS